MVLSIRDLVKQYPNGVKALDGVSLEIGKGMFGLLGPNGAGKSTLMRTIATLQSPDSGSMNFGDIDILKEPNELRKVLGYLPQDFGVYAKKSAEKLLDYFGILKGLSDISQRTKQIDYVLEITNLVEVRKKHVSTYSGGMKQRFGIAQLLLNNPKLIIVDEPTAGLDPAERNRFLNILREIGNESTVIFSTHIVEDIRDLCTDMAILNNGKVLLNQTPQAAIDSLAGSVWALDTSSESLSVLEEQFQILSSAFNTDNSLRVRAFSERQPRIDFRPASPSLEDLYFKTMQDDA